MNDPTSGLIDIVEPAKPILAVGSHSVWWLVAGVAVLMLLGGWMYWRGRCVRVFRKGLHQLEQAYVAGSMNQREVAYRLAYELQHGLRLRQLNADKPPPVLPAAESADWAETITYLDTLRYQAGTRLDGQQWTQLFSHANTWLRRAGRC